MRNLLRFLVYLVRLYAYAYYYYYHYSYYYYYYYHYYHYYYYYRYYCYYHDTTSNNDDAFSVVSVTTFCTIETALARILTPMCVLTFDVHLCITMYVLRVLYPL